MGEKFLLFFFVSHIILKVDEGNPTPHTLFATIETCNKRLLKKSGNLRSFNSCSCDVRPGFSEGGQLEACENVYFTGNLRK